MEQPKRVPESVVQTFAVKENDHGTASPSGSSAKVEEDPWQTIVDKHLVAFVDLKETGRYQQRPRHCCPLAVVCCTYLGESVSCSFSVWTCAVFRSTRTVTLLKFNVRHAFTKRSACNFPKLERVVLRVWYPDVAVVRQSHHGYDVGSATTRLSAARRQSSERTSPREGKCRGDRRCRGWVGCQENYTASIGTIGGRWVNGMGASWYDTVLQQVPLCKWICRHTQTYCGEYKYEYVSRNFG